jgi:hypothetical protein
MKRPPRFTKKERSVRGLIGRAERTLLSGSTAWIRRAGVGTATARPFWFSRDAAPTLWTNGRIAAACACSSSRQGAPSRTLTSRVSTGSFATNASTSTGFSASTRYGQRSSDGGSTTTEIGPTALSDISRQRSLQPRTGPSHQLKTNTPTPDCHNPWYEERGQVSCTIHRTSWMAIVLIVTLFEFPLYGFLIGDSQTKGRLASAIVGLALVHGIASAIAIYMKVTHM